MKRLFITGGQGFTGRYLCKAAQVAGFEVFDEEIALENAEAIGQALVRFAPTHVVHLAAISSATHGDEQAYYRVNVLGTQNLLRQLVAVRSGIEKVVVASSAAVYGNASVGSIDESTAPFPVSAYGVSKLATELVATQFFGQLPITISRPFNYTGIGHGENFVIPKIVASFAKRSPSIELGNIHVEREFNDVRFACKAYLSLLSRARPGETYNICTGKAIALNTVIEKLSQITGHFPEININPNFVRTNEIQTLFGNPNKLNAVLSNDSEYSFDDTLNWMLAQ